MSDQQQTPNLAESLLVSALSYSAEQPNKFLQSINQLETVLKKNIDARNGTDHSVINKFIQNSNVLSTIAEVTSVDAVKSMMKYGNIHDVGKNRAICKIGGEIDRIVIMLSGKFGIIRGQSANKLEMHASDEQRFRRILETAPELVKELKRKKFYINFDIREYCQLKTTKANLYELDIKEYVEKESIFNIGSLVQGMKYRQMLVTCSGCKVLTISSKIFYEVFLSFLKKQKADKIRVFRKLQCFSLIEDDKLVKIVEQLSLIRKKKGEFIYKEGDKYESLYLLFSGNIKITKTISLFREDPNSLYIKRQNLADGQHEILPFANLSTLFNYKPKTKLVELGLVSDFGIFGEEEYFAKTKRQVNAQISSQEATYYEINLKKLEGWISQKKNFVNEFTERIYTNRTEKKILYRQETLAELIELENKNNLDYFYLDEGEKKVQASVNKQKISKVNSVILPSKQTKVVNDRPAFYNTFNFTKLVKKDQKQASSRLSIEEKKVADLTHTVIVPKSSRHLTKKHSIDIHNPLFELSYFENNRKQALRIEKESRMKFISSRRSVRPRTSQTSNRKQLFEL